MAVLALIMHHALLPRPGSDLRILGFLLDELPHRISTLWDTGPTVGSPALLPIGPTVALCFLVTRITTLDAPIPSRRGETKIQQGKSATVNVY